MDTQVIIAIVAGIEAIAVAIIGGLFGYYTKKVERRADESRAESLAYRETREQHDREVADFNAKLLDLSFASANGVEVLLEAAHGDSVNGNVEKALKSLENAKSACNHSVNERVAKSLV